MDDGCVLSTTTEGRRGPGPAWVLVHGGPGGWDYLGDLAALLTGRTLVHRFDSRGCGSSGDGADTSLGRLARDLERLREHWGHERWIVLGHSFGAAVGLAAALEFPRGVAALGYLGGTGIGDWQSAYRARRDARLTPAQAARRGHLSARATRTPEQEQEHLLLGALADFADPREASAWVRSRPDRPVSAAMCLAQAAEVDGWAQEPLLRRCRALTVPLTALRGDADPRPREPVERLVRAVPRARLAEIPGAGHFPWTERPAAVREVLLRMHEEAS